MCNLVNTQYIFRYKIYLNIPSSNILESFNPKLKNHNVLLSKLSYSSPILLSSQTCKHFECFILTEKKVCTVPLINDEAQRGESEQNVDGHTQYGQL